MAPPPLVRRAREVTNGLEGLPEEGSKLGEKWKSNISTSQTILKGMRGDERHVFDTSPEASKCKMPVAVFWNPSMFRTNSPISFCIQKSTDQRRHWTRSNFSLDSDFGQVDFKNITWGQWPRHPA